MHHKWTGKGNARIYRHPEKQGPESVLVLHMHPSKEVRSGTAAATLKKAGIEAQGRKKDEAK